jgi:hypothetical protein
MYRYLLVQPNGDVQVFFVKACAELFKQIKGGGIVKEVYVGPEK